MNKKKKMFFFSAATFYIHDNCTKGERGCDILIKRQSSKIFNSTLSLFKFLKKPWEAVFPLHILGKKKEELYTPKLFDTNLKPCF